MIESWKIDVDEYRPDRDRLDSLTDQLNWLRDAGFAAVDHIWHSWMEHFVTARKG